MSALPTCVYACIPGTHQSQKRTLDPVGLESQMVVADGNQTCIFWKDSKYS